MKAMTYVIKFEENLNLGNIAFYLKEVESPIRLEIGDKIALSIASFDRPFEDNRIDRMMEFLLTKSIDVLKYTAIFEISDIIYNNEYYYKDGEINFYGTITLKGK